MAARRCGWRAGKCGWAVALCERERERDLYRGVTSGLCRRASGDGLRVAAARPARCPRARSGGMRGVPRKASRRCRRRLGNGGRAAASRLMTFENLFPNAAAASPSPPLFATHTHTSPPPALGMSERAHSCMVRTRALACARVRPCLLPCLPLPYTSCVLLVVGVGAGCCGGGGGGGGG